MEREDTDREFFLDAWQAYKDVPAARLDQLRNAIYIIDYSWKFLFVNAVARRRHVSLTTTSIGDDALDIFRASTIHPILDQIKAAVDSQRPFYLTVFSPLQTQVILKGHPLRDCYFISITVSQGKQELIAELREELAKRKL